MTAAEDRQAWLERRLGGVGASDVAGVMGRSPWASPYSIWAEKIGLVEPEAEPETAAMRFGRDLEPVIASWFHDATGLFVAGEQMMIWRPGTPWFATVDGFVFDGPPVEAAPHDTDRHGVALGVYEAKFTADPASAWAEALPEQYELQAQWAMFCAGLDHAWLAAFHLAFGRPVLVVHELERDPPLIEEAVAAVERFWGYVQRREPPPADGHRATGRALQAVHPAHDDDGVELDPEELAEVRALREARARITDAIEERENGIREALGDHAYGRVGGRLVASWKAQTSHRIDTKAVRRDHGTAYDRASTTRVLRYHGEART